MSSSLHSKRRSSKRRSSGRRSSLPKINIATSDLTERDIYEITQYLKTSPHFKKKYNETVGPDTWINIPRKVLESRMRDDYKLKAFSIVDPKTTNEMKKHLANYRRVKEIASSNLDPYKGDIEMEDAHERHKLGYGGRRKSKRNKKNSSRRRKTFRKRY
jgi:hypothetical protein